ncbi:MAG TPA: cation:proton antiporter subunit C [Hyphomonadaceae bacterium]|nr:cation:proton antiporter subunit C [Hyphomonadaceae bacterium]
MTWVLSHLNYVAVIVVMMTGLFIVFSTSNLIKRMIGLAVFQTATGLFFISLAKVSGGTAAIRIGADGPAAKALAQQLDPDYVAQHGVDGVVYSNPLPHVLILTAIVVGVATLAVGLAIAVRIRESYATIESDEIAAQDRAGAREAGSAS